jgi:hypothetical protein
VIYPYNDEQEACSKHVDVNYWNKLKVNSASCWFLLYGQTNFTYYLSHFNRSVGKHSFTEGLLYGSPQQNFPKTLDQVNDRCYLRTATTLKIIHFECSTNHVASILPPCAFKHNTLNYLLAPRPHYVVPDSWVINLPDTTVYFSHVTSHFLVHNSELRMYRLSSLFRFNAALNFTLQINIFRSAGHQICWLLSLYTVYNYSHIEYHMAQNTMLLLGLSPTALNQWFWTFLVCGTLF